MSSRAELQRRLAELGPWHFDIEVAPGLRTTAGNARQYEDADLAHVRAVDPEELRVMLDVIHPRGLEGRSFLDVGCNGGGYCFVARRLGAARTLGFDVRDHWIRQAEFLREVLPGDWSGMEFRVGHLDGLGGGETFDITLFKGVFYHLPDPIGALVKLCGATSEMIVVDSASRSDIPENALVTFRESTTHVMSGADGLAWLPGGPKAVTDILEHCGFGNHRTVYWHRSTEHGPPDRGRFRVVAARSASYFDHVAPPGA